MKSLYIGLGILGVIVVVSLIYQDASILFALSAVIGVLAILLAGLFSGAFNSGDRIRANVHSETKKQRSERITMSVHMLVIGAPSIIAAVVTYIFT